MYMCSIKCIYTKSTHIFHKIKLSFTLKPNVQFKYNYIDKILYTCTYVN